MPTTRGTRGNLGEEEETATKEYVEEVVSGALEGVIEKMQKELEKLKVDVVKKEEDRGAEQNIPKREIEEIVRCGHEAGLMEKFSGEEGKNPNNFLDQFDRRFGTIRDEARKIQIFENQLKGRAAYWFQNAINTYDSFEQVKEQFKEYFWGEEEQRRAIEKIREGRYIDGGKLQPDAYLLMLIGELKNTEKYYPMAERHKVELLSRQFGESFRNAVAIRGIEDIKGLLNCLKTFPRDIIRKECRKKEGLWNRWGSSSYQPYKQRYEPRIEKNRYMPANRNGARDRHALADRRRGEEKNGAAGSKFNSKN